MGPRGAGPLRVGAENQEAVGGGDAGGRGGPELSHPLRSLLATDIWRLSRAPERVTPCIPWTPRARPEL